MPKVSIVMPLYNKAPYVREAITSVLAQTHKNWELWVVDNGSTDGGDRIVQEFTDTRIQLLQSPKQGPGAARNYGLRHAVGEWALFFDADDVLKPFHLEELLAITQSQPEAVIIAGHWQEFQDGSSVDMPPVLMTPSGYGSNTRDFPESAIAFAPWAVHVALVKRKFLHTPFLWVEDLDPFMSEDTAFWFRLTSTFPTIFSCSAGALYRKGISTTRNRPEFPGLWFQAMKEITATNLMFLKQQHRPLKAKHCESLMRLYSGIYLLAQKQKDTITAQAAMAIADHWLQECHHRNGCKSFSLKVRKALGLRQFLPLMSWLKL
ncbi:glycosyltransferase family 2 protein [Vacuolonema iberomarrocanum]|uniref:glycosyltransferase family 2 protein n=1 Tax=Vacuolonema iberomarrocanum TaxID=3454632 RepID=UPI0019EA9353|nr:glycosyltransferase family 2 protein [filamentous cyanobacterium LEGE 07170]